MGAFPAMPEPLRLLCLLSSLVLLAGCETLAYYTQAIGGQIEISTRARPIEVVLQDPATDTSLRRRLESARAIREYASSALGLPDNGSYRSYADLGRPYVVWNVVAAPEFSTKAIKSCFPVAGCVTYRGFFNQAGAERHADSLRATGDDVQVAGIPAYSTLGWFDDPLLSSFISYQESELARLIFHELAHQMVYLKGDTVFNESFAVAVEREGVRRWLEAQGRHADLAAFRAARERYREFIALIETAKTRLERIYAAAQTGKSIESRRAEKRAAFDEFLREYAGLKARWGGFSGYDRIIGSAPNNALLASISAYSNLVPEFERILAESGGDLPRFYVTVKRIAEMPAAERCAVLSSASTPAGSLKSGAC